MGCAQCRVSLDPACDLVSIHDRQLDIHEDQIWPVFRRHRESGCAVICLEEIVADTVHQIADDLRVVLCILDYRMRRVMPPPSVPRPERVSQCGTWSLHPERTERRSRHRASRRYAWKSQVPARCRPSDACCCCRPAGTLQILFRYVYKPFFTKELTEKSNGAITTTFGSLEASPRSS